MPKLGSELQVYALAPLPLSLLGHIYQLRNKPLSHTYFNLRLSELIQVFTILNESKPSSVYFAWLYFIYSLDLSNIHIVAVAAAAAAAVVAVVVVSLGFTTLLTSQVISVAFYIEREKSDKFCSEAVISASGSFTCRKSTTGDQRLYFPSGPPLWARPQHARLSRSGPGFDPRSGQVS